MNTPIFLLIMLLCAAVVSLQSVNANTITVTNTNDNGGGSLRQALLDAVDGDTIDFSVTGTITLTSGQLIVDKSVTISGPGANSLAVDGNAASRVLYISAGKTVTISGLTITNGDSGSDVGGGIYIDHSALTVSESTISGNSTLQVGGGIFSYGATLTVGNSTFSGNSAGAGGGVYQTYDGWNNGSATLTVNNSTFSGNSAGYFGGGVYNYASNGTGTVTVNNSTFSGNSAGYFGGGVYNYASNGTGTVTVNNSSFSGNSAGYFGGGVYNYETNGDSDAILTMGNTILNAGSSGANIFNLYGTVTSLGYNLSSDDASAFLNATGDLNSTNPLLGPLQDNGGPTFTHALLNGSPAIDAGDPNFTPPPIYDQRGPNFLRVRNGRIDVGSFEVQAATAIPRAIPTPRPRPTVAPRP